MTNGSDVAMDWRKSSYSGSGNNCVEVAARHPGQIAVRDSKDPQGPKLVFTPAEWKAFTSRTKDGEFER
jgi:hypothetical protein